MKPIVAQCSATPASVAATIPCSATPFQRQLDVRHPWQLKGDRRDRAFLGGCSAILLLHLKNPRIPRKSAATRVARHVLSAPKIARFSAAAAAIFTAPPKIARFFEAPRCAISSAKKIASEPRFLLRRKWVKMVLAAEFPAIPSSAMRNFGALRTRVARQGVPAHVCNYDETFIF